MILLPILTVLFTGCGLESMIFPMFGPAPLVVAGTTCADGNGNGTADVCEAPACPGDLDSNNQVNISDLSILLSNFGVPGGALYGQGDLDGDGDVDISDLTLLLSSFGFRTSPAISMSWHGVILEI